MKRIVFIGSADFAIPTLKKLYENKEFQIVEVITKPDKPAGRGLELQPTPVKKEALKFDIPCREGLPTPKSLTSLNIDLLVVVAYGLFVPAEIFNNWYCVNLHPSLLPKYRGPSPLQSTLLNGERQGGITTMLLGAGMDDGDILMQKKFDIDINMDITELHDICANAGASLVQETLLSNIEKIRKKQDERLVTICKKIHKEDSKLNGRTPYEIHNIVRAIGGYLLLDNNKRVKITKTHFNQETNELTILEVQPEGKSRMNYPDYLRGKKPLEFS